MSRHCICAKVASQVSPLSLLTSYRAELALGRKIDEPKTPFVTSNESFPDLGMSKPPLCHLISIRALLTYL